MANDIIKIAGGSQTKSLEIKDIGMRFTGFVALSNVNFELKERNIYGLVGPNGAGKTTLLNVISGFSKPTSGEVIFKGIKISGLSPSTIARRGVVRTWQPNMLLPDQTVLDNILTAFHLNIKHGSWSQLLGSSGSRQEEREITREALDILQLTGLNQLKGELAKNLPHGFQRVLGVAMALATNPQLLLLDEPMTGMNLTEVTSMVNLVKTISREHKITILLVEHNMRAIMALCDWIIVLNYGVKIAEGVPQNIRDNPEVIKAYLGEKKVEEHAA